MKPVYEVRDANDNPMAGDDVLTDAMKATVDRLGGYIINLSTNQIVYPA